METIKYKDLENCVDVKEIDKDAMTITHYISTNTPDRYREVMNPKGCDDKEYRKNPVVFFGHRSRDLPIAKNEKIISDDFGVLAVTKFDSSDFAREVFRLNAEGFLNSWSIGFMPIEKPVMKDKYLYYEKWNLLEYSSVPIPANPDAVNLMLKEIKDERIKSIINECNDGTNYYDLKKEYEDLKNEIEEIKKGFNEEIIKKELAIFENRLVNKLFSLNKNILNIKLKG